MVDSCIACQATTPENAQEPLQMSLMPPSPWHTVHMDFFGPIATGDYLLVIIDAYSRFPEVEIVRSTAMKAIIPKLDRVFAVHGIPYVVRSDNGPPFNGEEFARYMKLLGVKHKPVTPVWPQANGLVESFNKPLNKAITSAIIEKKNWHQALQKFLFAYRTTPHTTTKVAPTELLFNRIVRGTLPELTPNNFVNRHAMAQTNDAENKDKMKSYADTRRNVRKNELKEGDQVIVKADQRKKLAPKFIPKRYVIKYKRGNQVTAERDGKVIKRNSTFFKKINSPIQESESESDYSDNETDGHDYLQRNPDHNETPVNRRRYPLRDRTQTHFYGQPIAHFSAT